MILTKDKILELAAKKEKFITRDLVLQYKVSRQYANSLIAELVAANKLLKLGSTRSSFYVLPKYSKKYPENQQLQYHKIFKNENIREDNILAHFEKIFNPRTKLPENIYNIFTYSFLEMVNNAIEHSGASRITIEGSLQNKVFTFTVNDPGIGIFKNIIKKRHLKSELEAIQELMKGKTTTMPRSHSGQGIFFTSKAADLFILNSFGYQLIMDNTLPDVFVKKTKKIKRGTQVIFKINIKSKRVLKEIFDQFTNLIEEHDYGFDKTQIHIKLYLSGGLYISRSQARQILTGLEKFSIILFDFDKVPTVGQAFADEIYRVFHNRHPHIKLEETNMNEEVKFMVQRAKHDANNQNSWDKEVPPSI